jgi:SAM-dependent methyltransferase
VVAAVSAAVPTQEVARRACRLESLSVTAGSDNADSMHTTEMSFDPLRDPFQMAQLIAQASGRPPGTVLEQLEAEFHAFGSSVRKDFHARQLSPHVWSDDLAHFYQETDAFLYELAIWNCNRIKRRMRRAMRRLISESYRGEPHAETANADVLVVGDGLGFDSLALAGDGHRVTYFEPPGMTQEFAGRLFDRSAARISIIGDPREIPDAAFDAVVCLDVLEHVPDPPAMIRQMMTWLRPAGRLVVHAPFYMVLPPYPTHLSANRNYAGNLGLFADCGLRLLDGEFGWNPLVLGRADAPHHSSPRAARRRLLIRAVGLYLALGRWFALPFLPLTYYHVQQNRWFQG